MLKNKINISALLAIVAVILFMAIDLGQNGWLKDSSIRKLITFTSYDIVFGLLGISIVLHLNKILQFIIFSWCFYLVEIIYSRFFNGSYYELYEWLLTVALISGYSIYLLIKNNRNGN